MKSLHLFSVGLLLCLCFGLTQSSTAQTIHFIGVFQSHGAPGSAKDKEIMPRELERISRATSMRVEKHIYEDGQVNAFKNKINSINPGPNDVIWFYYSGHGSNSGDGWPTFGSANIKESYVHEKLKSKGARLAITMYDCCNIGPTNSGVGVRTSGGNESSIYTWLFKNSKGSVKACSSSGGLLSYGNADVGGFFTSSFLKSIWDLNLEVSEADRIWDVLADNTKRSTNAACSAHGKRPQQPQFDVEVEDVSPAATVNSPDYFELPNGMSPSQVVAYCKRAYPNRYRNLTLSELASYNHGQEYYRGNRKWRTVNVRSTSWINGGTTIWLIPPPTTNGEGW